MARAKRGYGGGPGKGLAKDELGVAKQPDSKQLRTGNGRVVDGRAGRGRAGRFLPPPPLPTPARLVEPSSSPSSDSFCLPPLLPLAQPKNHPLFSLNRLSALTNARRSVLEPHGDDVAKGLRDRAARFPRRVRDMPWGGEKLLGKFPSPPPRLCARETERRKPELTRSAWQDKVNWIQSRRLSTREEASSQRCCCINWQSLRRATKPDKRSNELRSGEGHAICNAYLMTFRTACPPQLHRTTPGCTLAVRAASKMMLEHSIMQVGWRAVTSTWTREARV
jgi:hypothetical protein